MSNISFEDFKKIDLRLGTIVRADVNEKARNPAYKLWVDLGDEVGIKQSSAQITDLYEIDNLIGKRVICVVNFTPMKVAGFTSEVLVTGFYTNDNSVVLSSVDNAFSKNLPNGAKLA
jgi:tRNA-binding protein